MIFLYPTRFFEKKYHISSYSTTSNGLKSLKYLKSLKILNTLNAKNIPHHSPHTIRDDIKPYHIPVLCHTAHLHPQSTGEKRTLGYQYKKVGHSIKEKKIVFGGIQKLTMKEGMHRTRRIPPYPGRSARGSRPCAPPHAAESTGSRSRPPPSGGTETSPSGL